MTNQENMQEQAQQTILAIIFNYRKYTSLSNFIKIQLQI